MYTMSWDYNIFIKNKLKQIINPNLNSILKDEIEKKN